MFDERVTGSVFSCTKCTGLLLSRTSLPSKLIPDDSWSKVKELPEAGLKCPRCASRMHALIHLEVEVDVCAKCHSVWLDSGEEQKIRQAQSKKENSGEGADPVQVALDASRGGSSSNIQCSTGEILDGNVLDGIGEFIGDAIGGLLDGL